MTEITYLLGAGASAQSLPVVSNMEKRTFEMASVLDKAISNIPGDKVNHRLIPENLTFADLGRQVVKDVIWLNKIAKLHSSIDTYAKKLTISGNFQELRKLKIVTSIYLILEQVYYKYDKRYDSFLASIIDVEGNFPSNLNLLSWNYDFQLEMAYKDYYRGNKDISTLAKGLNMTTKFSKHRRTTGFSYVKLNGICGYHTARGWDSSVFSETMELSPEFWKSLFENYGLATFSGELGPSLSFAWEEDIQEPSIVHAAMDKTKDTEVLVVVGYSFPFFNRKVDREILNNMTNLKKIYYQDIHARDLQDRLQAVKTDLAGIQILPYTEVNQFFLPFEF